MYLLCVSVHSIFQNENCCVEDDPVGAVNELCCHDDVIVATGDREIAVIEVRNPIIRGHIAGT